MAQTAGDERRAVRGSAEPSLRSSRSSRFICHSGYHVCSSSRLVNAVCDALVACKRPRRSSRRSTLRARSLSPPLSLHHAAPLLSSVSLSCVWLRTSSHAPTCDADLTVRTLQSLPLPPRSHANETPMSSREVLKSGNCSALAFAHRGVWCCLDGFGEGGGAAE